LLDPARDLLPNEESSLRAAYYLDKHHGVSLFGDNRASLFGDNHHPASQMLLGS
jgi:hypothetical protein